jgi:hypothetical protein
MTTKQSNIVVIFIFGGYVLYSIFYPANSNNSLAANLLNISVNIISGIILLGLLQFLQNLRQLKFYFQTRLLYRNRDIRLSIAYLFRIKVDNQYLLVKSRTRNYFQPVGGAFKTLPGSEVVFEKLQVKPDRLIETEKGIAKGDLRVFVKGLNVIEFLEWFQSKTDRETSPWREFCEELVSTQILPWKEFRYIDYKYKKSIQTPIITLDSGDKGIFLFEVYDLVANNDQETILRDLANKGDTAQYVWADEHLINRMGHDGRAKQYTYDIAQHTKWAHNLKWSNTQ